MGLAITLVKIISSVPMTAIASVINAAAVIASQLMPFRIASKKSYMARITPPAENIKFVSGRAKCSPFYKISY
jgi:hypothetical protein